MLGHSFERICTKFGTWQPHTLQMVTEGREASEGRGLALHAPGNSEQVASNRNDSSAIGARVER